MVENILFKLVTLGLGLFFGAILGLIFSAVSGLIALEC